MKDIVVVGIGSGAPEQLTGQATAAIGRADVIFSTVKGSAADELEGLRRALCERWAPPGHRYVTIPDPPRERHDGDYEQAVSDWTGARSRLWRGLIEAHVADGGCGAFLAWGDPAFYDSTLRVLDGIGAGVRVEVVPGISSIQTLAAAHRLSLTRVGRAVHVTTGRRLARDGVPPGADDVVVMLDGDTTFTRLDPSGWDIYWGAYLGMPGQLLVAGPLAEVGDRIVGARAEARARRGWIMDTYLLRR